MDTERRILLGRVLGAFGVRGELKLHSFTDPPAKVLKYQPWVLVHRGVEREIANARGRDGEAARWAGDRSSACLITRPQSHRAWERSASSASGTRVVG